MLQRNKYRKHGHEHRVHASPLAEQMSDIDGAGSSPRRTLPICWISKRPP